MASDAGRSKEGLGLVLDLADQDDVSLLGSLGPSAAHSVKCACLAETQASPAPVLPMLSQPRTTPQCARQAQGSGSSRDGWDRDRVVLKTQGDNRQQRSLNSARRVHRCNPINWNPLQTQQETRWIGQVHGTYITELTLTLYICALQSFTF